MSAYAMTRVCSTGSLLAAMPGGKSPGSNAMDSACTHADVSVSLQISHSYICLCSGSKTVWCRKSSLPQLFIALQRAGNNQVKTARVLRHSHCVLLGPATWVLREAEKLVRKTCVCTLANNKCRQMRTSLWKFLMFSLHVNFPTGIHGTTDSGHSCTRSQRR